MDTEMTVRAQKLLRYTTPPLSGWRYWPGPEGLCFGWTPKVGLLPPGLFASHAAAVWRIEAGGRIVEVVRVQDTDEKFVVRDQAWGWLHGALTDRDLVAVPGRPRGIVVGRCNAGHRTVLAERDGTCVTCSAPAEMQDRPDGLAIYTRLRGDGHGHEQAVALVRAVLADD